MTTNAFEISRNFVSAGMDQKSADAIADAMVTYPGGRNDIAIARKLVAGGLEPKIAEAIAVAMVKVRVRVS